MLCAILGNIKNSSNSLDITTEKKQLREQFAVLKKEFSELYIQRENMLSHEQPLLTALYLQKIGYKMYDAYCLNVELSKLKFKIALLQGYVNRDEKPDINKVNKELESQFREYRLKIEAEAQRLAAARKFLNGTFLSANETKKIKEIFYIIVKQLHPDINPDLSENMKELFIKAQTAYELSDLHTLQQILLLLKNKESSLNISLPDLQEQVNHQVENNSALKKQIEQIYNDFPFTYKEKLEDEEWINSECKTINAEIERLNQDIEKFKGYVTLLEEWKPELQS